MSLETPEIRREENLRKTTTPSKRRRKRRTKSNGIRKTDHSIAEVLYPFSSQQPLVEYSAEIHLRIQMTESKMLHFQPGKKKDINMQLCLDCV